ncbi:Mur ligase [Pontibacillus halophilus JSM 076056 = DSM 19796]|uniref:Mur ligase n=1 Tax=Pontibacillus halophilus JSM 076056 = DSM 19796 TaxID=1385510 RepID=A0A0A5GR35_9BACI|nr:YheC/YheD family protein [Pontibacillus halophilus]KGX93713.1 Mur ligase [Pontibacillus halophilus JSM 076056 = DSM 19796]
MNPLRLDIPTIAITGSSGKTSTREMLTSILDLKWNVLRNTGNKNLPVHTKRIAESYNSTIDAIVLELGMGKPGAGKKHCSELQPNISVITNIGTAHYGNLGNSLQGTATNKSALIKFMKPDGLLLLNGDDQNSLLLDTSTFKGQIVKVGTKSNADYRASHIRYVPNGMKFNVELDEKREELFLPTYGHHNIENALFAIAIAHLSGFSATEIRTGLENYKVPIKRLNTYQLKHHSLLIDDTVNANPHSMHAALDVQQELAKGHKRIAVFGSMLELGDYSLESHLEVGESVMHKGVDVLLTYGRAAKSIVEGSIRAGFPPEHALHFKDREDLHRELRKRMEANTVVLVKGSSAMNMHKTVQFIKDRYIHTISIHPTVDTNTLQISSATLEHLNLEQQQVILHFGQLEKTLEVVINDELKLGEIFIPQTLSKVVTIPQLPYDYYWSGNHLHLGPVIGMIVYQRYIDDPSQQLLRFANYKALNGLIYFFFPDSLNKDKRTISGYYFNPETNSFEWSTFPFPNSIFNRIPLRLSRYKYLQEQLGDTLFNYPYGNTDKLEFWNMMHKQPRIKHHLPLTKKYTSVDSVLKALKKCNAVYLKPASMSGGNGIFHVKHLEEGYLWTDIEGNRTKITSKEQFERILRKELVKKKTYIIQKEIATFNKEGYKIDFRLYIQKDYTMKWRFSGIETKVGHKESVIANSKKRHAIIPGEEALQRYYGLTREEAVKKIDEITSTCIGMIKLMERKGHKLGDACFDLVADHDCHFFVLEPQINYAAEIKQFRDKGEREVLPAILPTPLEYAKALAGF